MVAKAWMWEYCQKCSWQSLYSNTRRNLSFGYIFRFWRKESKKILTEISVTTRPPQQNWPTGVASSKRTDDVIGPFAEEFFDIEKYKGRSIVFDDMLN